MSSIRLAESPIFRGRMPAGPLGGTSGHFHKTPGDQVALLPTPLRKVSAALGLLLVLTLPIMLSATQLRVSIAVQIAIMAAIAMNLVVGIAGQLSLAGAAFMAVGAFSGVILSQSLHVPFAIVLVIAPAVGALFGILMALPALRLRGLYLVLATLGFHYLVSYGTHQYEASRGAEALSGLIPNPPEIDWINWASATTWYYFLLPVVIGATLFAVNLRRSKFGRAWIALKDRDIVALSLGVSIGWYKILAFSVSGAMLGLAGALFSYTVGVVSSEYFSINLAIKLLAMVVIGGLGSTLGAWFGAGFVVLLPHLIQQAFLLGGASSAVQIDIIAPIQLVLFGLITIGFLLFEPAGLNGIWLRVRRYLQMWPLKHSSAR